MLEPLTVAFAHDHGSAIALDRQGHGGVAELLDMIPGHAVMLAKRLTTGHPCRLSASLSVDSMWQLTWCSSESLGILPGDTHLAKENFASG
jgi:hypothetical protein